MVAGQLTAPGRRALAERRASAMLLRVTPIALITIVGAVLRLWSFGAVRGNPFYDAAVRSMTLSWHNFFFGAFEPGGQVAVDKTPVDLWLQVAGVKLFGFSGVTVRLPEVIAGVLAIPLLYDLVRRLFGRTAGLAAAAALALLPAAILTAHSDTMDSLMMLLDVSAAWLVVRGAQTGRAWPVVAAGAVLGLAFNVKLFEALIVAPALAVLMLLTVRGPARRRVAVLGGSLLAFVAVALSWIVAASATPLGARPWPIGSSDGSIWSVVFGFNGVDRLTTPASTAALRQDPPGVLRFVSSSVRHYPAMVGAMLVAAVVLGVAAVALAVLRRRREGGARPLLAHAGAAFFGIWLIVGIGLLSHMQRLQPRYLDAVAPAIAATLGIGIAVLAAEARRRRMGGAALVVAAGAAAVTGALMTHPPAWAWLVIAGCLLAGAAAAIAQAAPRRTAALAAAAALLAVLVVPGWAAVSTARAHRSDAGLPASMGPAEVAQLSRFLSARQGSGRYEVVSPTVVRAAPLIIHDARPVLMLTSIDGRPLMGASTLKRLVVAGDARYALLGRGSCPARSKGPCAPVVRWAVAHGRDVGTQAGLPPGVLYRLRA